MSAKIERKRKAAPLDLQAEGRKSWKAFAKISAEIPGFEDVRRSPYFYFIDGAEDGKNLYTYFPFLFTQTFPDLSRRQMHKLSLMSLLYLYHILIADVLMDEEKTPTRSAILVSNAYSLKAFEVLGELFGARPLPWKRIMRLHHEYSVATLLEEQYHRYAINEYKPRDMFNILSGKSAMAKLILLSLCALAGRDEYIKPLMRSFDLYYLGDQLFDDFRDWKRDLRAGRYSYLLTQVITSCNLQEKIKSLDSNKSVEVVGKYLYLSGVVESYLTDIIAYWQQASESVAAINCPQWTSFLSTLQMGVSAIRSDIAGKARQLLLQPNKYDYRLIQHSVSDAKELHPQQRASHPVKSIASSVSASGRRAYGFLLKRYKPATGFEDFVVFGEQLPVWVSAYVGIALLNWRESNTKRKRASSRSLEPLLEQLAASLIGRQSENGWATNERAPEDADTTAWLIRFFLETGFIQRQVLCRAAESLLKYRTSDGGFSTYLPDALGEGFKAYCNSHVEVTAVVLETLIRSGSGVKDEVIKAGMKYIKDRQEAGGLWQAYWWDGQMYATYHCLRAQQAGGEPLTSQERAELTGNITARQGEDGSWGDDSVGKNRAFETALALKSLLLLDQSLASSATVERGIIWLLSYQGANGSWDSSPMMRVPNGNDSQPWNNREWKLDSPNGIGILVRDQNKLFTTATVLAALTDFLSFGGDRHLIAILKGSGANSKRGRTTATTRTHR